MTDHDLMDEPEVVPRAPKLSFGPVIQGVFGVLKRNFATFLGITLLLEIAPMLLIGAGGFQAAGNSLGSGLGLIGLGYLALLVASAILTPALVHGAVADLNGRRPTIAECLRSGVSHALPVFVILLLTGIGVMFGFLLFIVPGVILFIGWSVAAPAQIVEKTGIFGAFGRSRALTKGSRWRIFWLFVLWAIVSSAVQQTLLGLAGVSIGGAAASGNPMAFMTPAYGVVTLVITVASTLISYTGLAVIYYELRRLKEGIGPEALASIFD